MPTSPDELESRIALCLLRDRAGLARRVAAARKRLAQGQPAGRMLAAIDEEVNASIARREARAAALPKPTYPEDLPVVAAREEILVALAAHQVVIVCGETGSGKTTQLPKLCLELGRGVDGLIGHTQPRRIAARSVAARIAEELKSRVGEHVGFKVRFSDHVGESSCIKLMTDGILLAELQSDPALSAYDTIIIDEAHERSLNIDFLLGYLRRLLPRRPDLKLVVTSATLDPERIARHFGDAPILRVEGRSYPVEVRFHPLTGRDEDDRDRDLETALLEAVDECARHGPGDVLVFLPGEREIREAAEALRKHHPKHTEILPLYARLSAAEQNRVFEPHTGRRIVLATNVAETALTVPGIRYVVDTGLARLARYSPRSRMQRLSLEAVSQASASQRAGRCGRLGPGLCIRLYGEDEFAARAPFTDPEILRTNLAAVILRMADLGLIDAGRGDPLDFPFVDPPDARLVRDGYRVLSELRAIDERHRITDTGRRLARLPVDPRLGAVLLAATSEACLREALVICAFLAIQDPRLRPPERQAAADQAHAAWRHPDSDFLSLLKLWEAYHEQARHLSRNKLRGWCEERFLSYLRMREWHELHGQLKGALTEMELRENDKPAEPAAIHRALIAGFAAHAGNRTEKGDFLGAHGRRFHVHPGSGMAKKPPRWLLAAEVVETTRVYARMCAKIEPEWIESAVPHLLRHHHFEPHFEERAGTVAAFDRVSLFGLVVQPRRRVNYGRIDAADARRIFIREGLVEGRLRTRGEFLSHNRALVAEVEALEAKGRRRDLLVDEQTLFDFYDARLPAEIHDGAGFERWRKRAEREDAKALLFTREALMQQDAAHLGAERFPDRLEWNGLRLPLAYRFEPGAEDDGVSVSMPAAALNGLDAARAEWLVPGLLEERVAALIRSLPKGLRKHFVPAPDFARAALARIEPGQGSLLDALADVLRQMTGVEVPRESWNEAALEAHLRLRLRVLDEEGREIAAGRDLQSLKDELSGRAERSFEQTRPQGFEREGITDWDFGELPEHVDFERHGIGLRGWPALDDRGDTVALVLCDAPAAAAHTHRAGLRRLFMLRLREPVKYLQRHLPGIQSMCLQYASVDRCETLKEDLIFAAVERAAMQAPWPRERETFDARCDEAAARVVAEANDLCALAARILERHHAVRARLKGSLPLSWIEAAADMRDQLDHLVYPHFLLDVPAEWLAQYPRWLDAVERRMQRLDREPDKDRRLRVDLLPLWEDAKARLVRTGDNTQVQRYRWLIEELRVSLFAQELGTVEKVSVRRLEDLRRALG